jgi:flavin-binding protein dodecin
MSVAKNIEISSTSPSSFEDAIEKGIARAASTINNVSGAWIKDQKINISDGRATEYQVVMIITFVLDDAGGDDDDDGGGSSGGRGGKSGGKGKKR